MLDAESVLHLCSRCGHLFTTVAFDVISFYRRGYDAVLTDGGMDELAVLADGSKAFRTEVDSRAFLRAVERYAPRSSRYFEYGCGRGRMVSRLLARGVRDIHVYDLSDLYRAPLVEMLGVDRVALGARPSVDGVDVAYSTFVLEHVEEPIEVLAFLKGTLVPEGVLYLALPSYETNLLDLACADHLQHFKAATLVPVLEACGYVVLEVDEVSTLGTVTIVARNTSRVPVRPPRCRVEVVDAARARVEEVRAHLAHLRRALEGIDAHEDVYLYGAGFHGALAAMILRGRGVLPAGVFDANPKKHGALRFGAVVRSPEDALAGASRKGTLLVCVNRRASGEIVGRFGSSFSSVVVA